MRYINDITTMTNKYNGFRLMLKMDIYVYSYSNNIPVVCRIFSTNSLKMYNFYI